MHRAFSLAAILVATSRAGAMPSHPHPEPRVIVNVVSVQGPHARSDVERSARQAWGKIIRCYKSIDRRARGMVSLELVIAAAGRVTGARRTRTTLASDELAACLTRVMEGLPMPKAEGRSVARTEVHVAPGDPPGD